MNLFQIITELEKVDPEIMDRLTHRRSALTALGDLSKKFALAAAPIAIGSAFNKAVGQNTLEGINKILNYALLLEYIEEDFYAQALAAPTLAPNLAPDTAAGKAIRTIKAHESAHVVLLKTALGAYGGADAKPASFDFGLAFTTYPEFLKYAQAFEDTGVRAYKGQATKVQALGLAPILQVALQVHSVEARHASHIRYMRRSAAAGGVMQYGWITGKEGNGVPDAVYGPGNPVALFPADDNTTQATINLVSGLGTPYTAAEVSEAFDEGLDNTTVTTIAKSVVKF